MRSAWGLYMCLPGYLSKQPLCLIVQLIGEEGRKGELSKKKRGYHRKFGMRIYKRKGIKVNNMLGIPGYTDLS